MRKLKINSRIYSLILGASLALSGCGQTSSISEDTVAEKSDIESSVDETNNQISSNKTIDRMENGIVTFTNDQLLPNGVFEITESNLIDKTKLITDAYLLFNIENIDAKTFGTINQNGELDEMTVTNNFMKFVEATTNSIAISNASSKLNVEDLFVKNENNEIIDKNDYEYLKTYVDLAAEYNQALIDNNQTLISEKLNQLIAIKEAIITDPNVTQDISAQTLFMVADSMLLLPNVVTEEDTKIQLVNSIEEACEDKITTNDEIDNTMKTEASKGSYESRFLTLSCNIVKSKLELANDFNENCDLNYSYSTIVERISKNIDLSKFVKPSTNFIDQENARQQAMSDASDKAIGSTSTTPVTPDKVPESEQVPSTEEIRDPEGNVVPLTEQELIEANNMGDAQAVSDFNAGYRNPNPYVAGKCTEWNNTYAWSYNQTYNGLEDAKRRAEEEAAQSEVDFNNGYEAGAAQAQSDFSMGFRNTNPGEGGKSQAYNNGYVTGYNCTYDVLISTMDEKNTESEVDLMNEAKIDILKELRANIILSGLNIYFEEETQKRI